jgi:putative transposase
MVTPAAQKEVVAHLLQEHPLSQRQACTLAGLPTCSWRYQSRRQDDALVRGRLKELAQEPPRFGYRRLGVLLGREGHNVNLKRVLRLYREEGLKLRAKKRKRITSSQRVRPETTTAINQIWSMDFVADTLSCGRRFAA